MDNNKSDLLAKIRNEYSTYSKGHKAIANYILDNYDKAAFMTASVLGETAGVSESTVVRFAYALGYSGYPKLQKHLQEIIKNKLTNIQRLNMLEGMSTEEVITAINKMESKNLRATFENLDIETFEKVTEDLINAKRIYVIGFRSCAPLVQFMVYYLGYIFDNVHQITIGTSDIYSQLVHVNEGDVVIGMAFPRYSSQTVEGVKFAKERHAKIITITDNNLSPLYNLSDHCILTKNNINSFVDSFVAPLSIINTMIILVGLKKKDVLTENYSIMENIWREKHVYAVHDYAPLEEESSK
ncbi:MAG: MurR/RpiR family transcriptional regulator [Clostridia bacterium]|nr:MurR/RpiR family transcriptional regulator [Clostridia bacterium]MBR3295320.1 MurR/RpiR family transcriptional regulator [Clostridia bacterium]